MLEELLFVFPPQIQAGLSSGAYEVVKNSAGVALGMVRDKATGQFVGHAVGMMSQPFLALSQIALAPISIIGDGILSFQMDRGFQKTYGMLNTLQSSVGVLQATTALIGVASIAGVALSAANLYQIIKLKQDIKELKLTVENGFSRSLEAIYQIPDAIKFEQHRTILIMAYGQFLEATKLMKLAMKIEDSNARNTTLGNAQLHLSNALNAYNQNELFQNTCAAGQLRRFECVWIMEQAQAFNYQLLNAPEAASHSLQDLQERIRRNSLQIIDNCQSEEELDFIYPEIAKIQSQDLPVLATWQNHIDWSKQLSPSEKREITALVSQETNFSESEVELVELVNPPEIVEYEQLKTKSHYESLLDQLKLLVKPQLRQDYESYIRERATATEHKGIASGNWQEASDLSVANMYHYFKHLDKQYV